MSKKNNVTKCIIVETADMISDTIFTCNALFMEAYAIMAITVGDIKLKSSFWSHFVP